MLKKYTQQFKNKTNTIYLDPETITNAEVLVRKGYAGGWSGPPVPKRIYLKIIQSNPKGTTYWGEWESKKEAIKWVDDNLI